MVTSGASATTFVGLVVEEQAQAAAKAGVILSQDHAYALSRGARFGRERLCECER
jgi:hypothetical protein